MVLLTSAKGHCGRTDRCGDEGGTPSAIPGHTTRSGKAGPEADRERKMQMQVKLLIVLFHNNSIPL